MKLLVVLGIVALAAVGVWLRSRVPKSSNTSATLARPGEPLDDAVHFTFRELPSNATVERRFECSFTSERGTSRFELRVRPTPVPDGESAAMTKGELRRLPGSTSQPLLAALATVHGKTVSARAFKMRNDLPIDVGWFGDRLVLGPGGGYTIAGAFTSQPPGDWIALKVFLPSASEVDEPAELFVGLHPASGEGLLLPKDPDYWPQLELALRSIL